MVETASFEDVSIIVYRKWRDTEIVPGTQNSALSPTNMTRIDQNDVFWWIVNSHLPGITEHWNHRRTPKHCVIAHKKAKSAQKHHYWRHPNYYEPEVTGLLIEPGTPKQCVIAHKNGQKNARRTSLGDVQISMKQRWCPSDIVREPENRGL